MARTIARDHDDKRRMILDRAAGLFADDGFDRSSISKVAAACDISKANIYHYYSGKDEILFDILDQYLSALAARIVGLDLAGLAPEAALLHVVTEILLAYQGSDNEHRLQVNAMTFLSSERRDVLLGHQRALVARMNAVVEPIAPDAFAGDPARLRATTMSIFGMVNWFYMWSPDADRAAREEYAAHICRLCVDGIRGL